MSQHQKWSTFHQIKLTYILKQKQKLTLNNKQTISNN